MLRATALPASYRHGAVAQCGMLCDVASTESGYALLDAGSGRRLERFGGLLLERPAPGAVDTIQDERAAVPNATFARGTGWHTLDGRPLVPWTVDLDGLRLELRATDAGQVGLFPEQIGQLPWLTQQVADRRRSGSPPPRVLNLFAYTGLVTLALASAGADTVHVDASRPTVAWARRNAELSGLAEATIRWLVDDAPGLIAREARRGRRYDGIVLDPPSYGHGPRGRAWRLVEDLPALLDACAAVIAQDGFVLLTSHTIDVRPDDLANALAVALGRSAGSIERGELRVAAVSGARLSLGAFARTAR